MPDDVSWHASKHELTQAAMPIGTHNEEIGIDIRKPRQDFITDADVRSNAGMNRWLDAVPCQGSRDRCIRRQRALLVGVFFDLENMHIFGVTQKGKSIEH